jgi:hypothetical protein
VIPAAGGTFTGTVIFATGANPPSVIMNGGDIFYSDIGVYRWVARGTNAQSQNPSGYYELHYYNDSGAYVGRAFAISRYNGGVLSLGGLLNGGFEAAGTPQVCIRGSTSAVALTIRGTVGATNNFMEFFVNAGGTIVGSIQANDTASSYNTTSDARLKTNAEPFTRGRELVDRLKVVDFEWLADSSRDIGLIAQDVRDVVPGAFAEGRGEPDDEDFIPHGLDYSKLVPLLIQALQEAFRQIDELRGP